MSTGERKQELETRANSRVDLAERQKRMHVENDSMNGWNPPPSAPSLSTSYLRVIQAWNKNGALKMGLLETWKVQDTVKMGATKYNYRRVEESPK